MDIGVQLEIIQKSGSWFSYNGERIGQGREKVKDFLSAHPEVADSIEAAVRENVGKLYSQKAGKGAASDKDNKDDKGEAAPAEAGDKAPAEPAPEDKNAPAKKPAVSDTSLDITVDD